MVYNGVNTTVQNYLSSKQCFETKGKWQIALYNPSNRTAVLYEAYMPEVNYQLTTMGFEHTAFGSW
jgi:hypothetical protein